MDRLLALLLIAGYAAVEADPISIQAAARSPGLKSEGDVWRPVRDSAKHTVPVRLGLPTSAYYVDLGLTKKLYHVGDHSPSNKVEVFAPAPPTILGSFSGFGHDTVKSRHPVKLKKPYKEAFQPAETRYPPDLLHPPYRHFPQPFKPTDSVGQAYYFEASLSPPPRESAINLVPPPSSKLTPNSYYLQFDQQTRPKPAATFSPYLRQGLPLYSTPEYYKTTHPSTDPYRFYTPDPPSKLQFNSRPINSHGRPPGIDYFGTNPFGDIHLNTNKPETKTPAKDIFDQLSHLGRPFQSSTIEPPRFSSPNTFSSLEPVNYYSTSGNLVRQTTPKPFRPSPLISETYPNTERPVMFVTPGPSVPSREVFPLPVTTLDIPSREDIFNRPLVNTYQPLSETQQYHEEVTNRPSTTTYFKHPEAEVNTKPENIHQSTSFVPTPSTDIEPYVGEPAQTELITPSPETNEVQKPVRTRPSRPRYRKKKPSRKPEQQFIETTTDYNNNETPVNINQYTVIHEDSPKVTTYDTLQNNYQPEPEREQEPDVVRYDEKPKKRRPARPNYPSTSTFTNTEPDIQETPTGFTTVVEEEEKTFPPSSTTTEFNKPLHRRRKKPTNRIRGSTRHGLTRSSTTTTEPPQELSSDVATEYQTAKENYPTENYPIGIAFNEYGHIMQTGTEDLNINTLYPTQQIDEYQTNYHEIITTTTTTTTEPPTTTPSTSAPESTPSSSTTSKSRLRNKYNFNNTRPRFSVKDYRERLNKATSTSTETPKDETEQRDTARIRPTRLRGSVNYKQTENQEEVETSTRRAFKPRYTGQRHAYRTSTTASPLLQLDTPTTTERINSFRPSAQRRPGSSKYYSRYRTSTEAPDSAEHPITDKLPQRPKGVFSAKKRRPFPLRTRTEATNSEDEDSPSESNDLDHDHDQYMTKKSDHVATTTLMSSSEEAAWDSASSSRPEVHTLDSLDHGEITKKIADLTSSPSNSFDSSGFFKGVSPSSRRTVSQITLATEDPILPIEAFFSSSLNKNGSR